MPRASVSQRRGGEAGRRRSSASAVRRSRTESSSSAGRISSRVLSLTRSTPPNLTSAWRRASSGLMPGAAVLLGLLIDVEANLLVEAALERVAPAERSEPLQLSVIQLMMRLSASIVASSTRLTARDMRRHCASSSLSCRRPARVSE